jgi:hypothetical protein
VNDVAASIAIEEDAGVLYGHVHPHDGYYAGEFALETSGPRSVGTDVRAAHGSTLRP